MSKFNSDVLREIAKISIICKVDEKCVIDSFEMCLDWSTKPILYYVIYSFASGRYAPSEIISTLKAIRGDPSQASASFMKVANAIIDRDRLCVHIERGYDRENWEDEFKASIAHGLEILTKQKLSRTKLN